MLKKLAGSIREYKKQTILTPIVMIGEVAMEVTIPLLMASLIDNGIDKGDFSYIWKIGLILIGCAIISLFFGFLGGKLGAEASAGFAKNLRHDMYYKVQDFSFSNIDKFSTASIVTRVTSDVMRLQMSYQMMIRMAIRSPMMLIFAMIMAFSINSKMALIFLSVVPILAIGLYFIMTSAHPFFKRVFKHYDKLNLVVQENLRGIRVVKTFNREELEKKKFKDTSEDIYNDFTKAEKILALNSPLMQFCVFTCIVLISWLGARLIVNTGGSEFTTGELMSMFTYTMQILMSLMMVSMVIVMLTISRAAAERVTEILNEESDIVNCPSPIYEVKDGSITFENVGLSYAKDPDKLCLKDVNLDIKSGETVGIIGGTGSSKSSLVQLIPRLYDVTTGSLKIGGVDVREYDIQTLRSSVAMVLQKNVLFSGTIKENLRWGKQDATDEEMIHACTLAQAHPFISEFPDGYDTHIEQGGSNVSGGQKQRLCIARALLAKPKILILDDSTSAVDTKTDAMIRRAFREEIPDTTKLIIAQRISSVADADKIIVLDGGKIDAVGTHEELLKTNDIYKEVYYSQQKGGESDE